MRETPVYNVYAIKYATREARKSEHFYGLVDPHEDYSMPMDYFVWVAISNDYTIVIDTGFNEQVAKQRKRTFLRCPIETMRKIGIDADTVPYVILTHLHYDHVGNLEKFQKATFVVQKAEMAFWTGKYASKGMYRQLVEVNDVLHLVQKNFEGRIQFVNGNKELVPGITVYQAGGHAEGLQIVKVNTEKGNIILASDVTHFYQNIYQDRPFSIVHHLAGMYDAFELVRTLAKDSDIIIPGHDPEVIKRFPAASPELKGIVVKIA